MQSTEAGSLERERRCRKASRSGGGSSHSGVESSRSGEEAVAAGEAAPQGPSFRPGGPGACACGRRYRAAPAPQNRRCPQPLPARSGRRPGAGCCPKSRTPAAPTGGQNVRRSDSQMRQLESVAPYAIGRRPPAAKFAVWIYNYSCSQTCEGQTVRGAQSRRLSCRTGLRSFTLNDKSSRAMTNPMRWMLTVIAAVPEMNPGRRVSGGSRTGFCAWIADRRVHPCAVVAAAACAALVIRAGIRSTGERNIHAVDRKPGCLPSARFHVNTRWKGQPSLWALFEPATCSQLPASREAGHEGPGGAVRTIHDCRGALQDSSGRRRSASPAAAPARDQQAVRGGVPTCLVAAALASSLSTIAGFNGSHVNPPAAPVVTPSCERRGK